MDSDSDIQYVQRYTVWTVMYRMDSSVKCKQILQCKDEVSIGSIYGLLTWQLTPPLAHRPA